MRKCEKNTKFIVVFPKPQWLRERIIVLSYTHMVNLVILLY